MGHCAHGIFLATEDTCWPSMVEALVTGDFDHTSLGREIPFKDDQASVWLDWVGERTHHILARCLYRHAGFLTDGPSARSQLLRIDQAGGNKPLNQQWHSSGTIQIDRHILPAWLQISQQRSTLAYCIKIVDDEGNVGLAGHRQQVQNSIGRATGCSYTGYGILKRLARQNITWRHSTPQDIYDELAATPGHFILARVGSRNARRAHRGEADKLQSHGHSIGGKMPTPPPRPRGGRRLQ